MMGILVFALGFAVVVLSVAVFILSQIVHQNTIDIEDLYAACAARVMNGAEALHRAEKNIHKHTIESGQS